MSNLPENDFEKLLKTYQDRNHALQKENNQLKLDIFEKETKWNDEIEHIK